MILSEKELEEIIDELDAGLNTLATPQEIAHAIAKELAKGVAWQGTAVFDWDGTMPALYLDDEPSADVLTSGDFFTVAVTKEE